MVNGIQNVADLHKLIKTTQRKVKRRVLSINPSDSNEWIYDSQSIRHQTGGFFRIVGLRHWSPAQNRFLIQPIIDQPEIGVLAFAIRGNLEAREILVQTKCEPGNVGAVQIAPTCQATQSNLSCLHGGIEPPGARLIKNAQVISNGLHSEQGTRFWHKQNQNLVVQNPPEMRISSSDLAHLHWLPMKLFRQTLGFNFLTNTDARSVIASSDWETVLGENLFEPQANNPLSELLTRAWKTQSKENAQPGAEKVLGWLTALRQQHNNLSETVPLSEVPHLQAAKHGLVWAGENSSFDVRQVQVSIRGRERETWDQPLIDSHTNGEVSLLAFEKNKNFIFVFRAQAEPGLKNLIELNPSICRSPGTRASSEDQVFLRLARAGRVLKNIKQSDEGGRFWRDVTTYRIVLIEDPGDLPECAVGLSLREISVLATKSVFTNEARSVISLLLSLPV